MRRERDVRAARKDDTRQRPPAAVRLAAWFFLLASVAGFLSGILEAFASVRTGMLTIPVPVAVGVTGLALFRGLRGGSVRAWKWARGLSIGGALGVLAMCALVLVAPRDAAFSALGGRWPVASVLPVLIPAGVLGIGWFAWLFRALGAPAARRFFHPAPQAPEQVPALPTEAAR